MPAESANGNEECDHNDRDQRPVVTVDNGIEPFCDDCYREARAAGRLDLERDAEVFGYAQ